MWLSTNYQLQININAFAKAEQGANTFRFRKHIINANGIK